MLEWNSARCEGALEYLDHGTHESLVVPDKLSFLLEIQALVEEAESGEEKEIVLVEAERKVHVTFFEKLDDLYDVFTGVCKCDNGRGSLSTEGRAND